MYWIRHYELETNYHCIKTGFDTTLSTPMFMIYSEYIQATNSNLADHFWMIILIKGYI